MNMIINSKNKDSKTKIELDPNDINDFFLTLPETILTQEMREHNENYICSPELIQFCSDKKNTRELFYTFHYNT